MYKFLWYIFCILNFLAIDGFSSFQQLRITVERGQNFKCYSCNNHLKRYPSSLYNTTSGKVISVCNKCCNGNEYIYSWIDMYQVKITNKIESIN